MAEFRLLGAVFALVDGEPVDLGPARQRCVLAALAVDAGQVVSVDRLIHRVWGEQPPLRARETLVNYVSRLRQVLAASTAPLVRRSGGYVLAVAPSTVDLHRFRDLRARARAEDDRRAAELLGEALGLWRGDAMTGLVGDWSEGERDRLHRERLDAECDLADVLLRLGRGDDLVAGLTTRVAEHPLDERIAGQYLLALHQAGRTSDALEHYRLLRERLVAELGADPGPPLRGLHLRILAADPELPGPALPGALPGPALPGPILPGPTPSGPPLSGTAAGTSGTRETPHQLPAAPALFTGRTAELVELDLALADLGTAVTCVISGSGGIGKSWLALTWAHRNLHRFPDGQLHVDLGGFGPGDPKQVTDVLADFLTALGVDRDHHPRDLDALAALYRTRSTGKRLLVLLDNAATSEQVVPLLPGGSACTVLVTSRHRLPALLTRHSARPVRLDVLSETEARALVHAALGDVRATAERAVTELIGLCGGFPLALGLVAAHIRTDPELLDDLVTELRELGPGALDSDDPAVSLPAVLSWSLRHLTERQRTTFGLLGTAFGPDVDPPAAAALTGLPVRDTRAALRALVDASLLTRAPGDRYAMHDLIRAYAASTARDESPERARQAALERLVDFYRHTAHAAAQLLNTNRLPIRLDPPAPGSHPRPLRDRPAATAWLDAHRPHLSAAQRTAASLGHHGAVWHLAWAASKFYRQRGHRHDDLTAWQAAVDAADHLPDPTAGILAHRLLGFAHANLDRHEHAAAHLRRALTLAEHHDDRVQQAHTHHVLSRALERRGDLREALEHACRALSLYRDLGESLREALLLNAVGWYTARLGDHDTAREHCRTALDLHRRHHNAEGEAYSQDALGYIEHHAGHHHEAIDHYQRAIPLFRELGNTAEVAHNLDNLGHPQTAVGLREQARASWQEALELYRQQGRTADADRVQQQLDELDRSSSTDSATGRDELRIRFA
ncbi:BTAD domain-containing putative transcriptional regulator [Actinosynnema sp. NPDC002837]